MGKLTCVILNYNSSDLTFNLARHISSFESVDNVVVIDNNSMDNSKYVLPLLEKESSKIKIILEDINWGYAKGNNRGAKYAIEMLHSDFIVVVNPDVTFKEDYIVEVTKLIESDPKIMIASAIARDIDGKISYCCYWNLPTYTDYIRKFFSLQERKYQKRLLVKQKSVKEDHIFTEAVSGACFMARKEVFQQLGGFDENTFLYCEESILGGKVKNAGYKEAITFNAFYNHNHQYKTEDALHKFKHYRIMLESRKYYLREIVGCNKFQMSAFSFLSAISLMVRKVIWDMK